MRAVLADHDVNESILTGGVRRLPQLDLLRARDLGLDRAADAEILARAAELERVVITSDARTIPEVATARLEASQPFFGLIVIPQSLPIGAAIQSLVTLLRMDDFDHWEGLVVRLPM